MKLANIIQKRLKPYVANSGDILIPNYFYGGYEMDLFRLTNSGIVYEYEISRSDFFTDFKKGGGRLEKKVIADGK